MACKNPPPPLPLRRPSSLPPQPPRTPEREQNRPPRYFVNTDSDSEEEYVFPAVAVSVVIEVNDDDENVLTAVTEEKPVEAKSANSKKEGPNDGGAKSPM